MPAGTWRRSFRARGQGAIGSFGRRSRRGRPSRQLAALRFDSLESRFALAAVPTATVTGPIVDNRPLTPLIGTEVPLTVTFDNTATNPDDIGYAPFVDIVMPVMGDAPPTPADGISFKPGSATYNGLSLQTTILTFDAAGTAKHPFAKNPDGTPVVVTGKPGDQLVVVQLPFGSYGPDQPAAEIQFTGVISPLAQPGHTYPVTATGGFQFQTDTAGNPTVNVATLGATTTDPLTPQVFRLHKTSDAPEYETATGPNFTHTYTVSMAVAPGQTVTDLRLEDVLPGNVQFVAVTAESGNQTTSITPASTPSTATPGGLLARVFDKVVGTGSNSDAVLSFTYFVPQLDEAGSDVIPLGAGGSTVITNQATAQGQWTSANPNFPGPQTIVSNPNDPNTQHTLTARTLALQKTVADLTNPGSPRAGDTIEYTLYFQVSDYFALQDLDITDLMSDGQEFDASFTPTLSFTQKSQSFSAAAFDPANVAVSVLPDGSTSVTFDVASQLDTLGLVTDRNVVGAGIPDAGTGSPSTPPDPLPSGPGTRGSITFRAVVLDEYRQTPRPGADVVQGDVMTDVATTTADILAYSDLAPTGSAVTDGSSESFTLVSGGVTKEIYAVNGAAASGTPVVTAGDEVTFRITYNLPFSSIKDYTITDFLPLPIFAAQDLTFAGGAPSADAPAAGQWKFGPSDNYSMISRIIPTTSFSAAANSQTWDFGTFQYGLDLPSTTDILFTVTATNKPFGDGLLLTNQAEQMERNETGDVLTSNTALAQVRISEPLLGVTKGVVSTTNPAGVFTPPTVAPAGVTFSAPGVPGASFTGTITSTGLASQPIDAALSNVLGNDLVKFCIVVENTGSGVHGAFDVAFRDTFDSSKLRIPAGGAGLNLRITDGTGTALAYTGDLFGSGVTLVDPSSSAGALTPGKSTAGTVLDTGTNIAVITYDLELLPTVAPLDKIPNTATVTNYASAEGGPNFLPPSGISDTTTVTVRSPQVAKSLVGTSIVDPYNTNTQAVIGELAEFELTIDVPQGTTPSAVVVDSLPTGLAFVEMVGSPVVDPGVSFTGSATPVVSNSGRTVTFNLGDVVNTNADQQLHGITLRYKAVVLNVSTNTSGKTLRNSAKLSWTGHSELPAAHSASVTVIEPKLTVTKTASAATAQASDVVTYTILVSAVGSQTTAQNVNVTDVLPGGVTYVAGSLAHSGGVAPTTLGTSAGGDAFTATFDKLTPGQTSTLTFRARLDPTVVAGQAITNTVTETWTSLPGNPGQITPNNPNAYERTGSGTTSQGQRNDYRTSGSAIVTVAQPTVAKSLVTTSIVSPSNTATQAVVGETATYTVTMTIPQGRTPAAQLIDTMGPGLAYVRTISAVNNAPGKLVVPGLAAAPVLTSQGTIATWNLGDIVNSDTDSTTAETITFTIEAVVLNVNSNTSGVLLVNTAQAAWGSGSSSPVVTSAPVTVIEPKLRTLKTVSVGGYGGTVGDPVTYTIVVRQSGTSDTDAFNVTLRDVIPAQIGSPVLASVVDTAGQVTAANFGMSGNTLTTTGSGFDLPKLPADRTITLTVTGTLAGPIAAGQKITNTNQIKWTSLPGAPGQITPNNPSAYERTGSGSTSQGQLNNYVTTGSATFMTSSADLGVVKTVSNATPNVGDTITFTVTLSNSGPSIAHEVEVTDQFPTTGLQFLAATPSQGSYDPGTGVWTVGTVNVGAGAAQTLTITAKVLAPAANTIPAAQTNVATVTNAAEPDPNPGNNTGTATETPQYADLAVTKRTDKPQPNVGETITYTVTLSNLGTATATGVEVTDTLPANVTYVSSTAAAGTTFTPSATGGVWSVPTIAPNQTILLTITATATASGVQFNTVGITKSDVWDPNDGNNTAKTPTDPQEADLVVGKTVDNATPNVGDVITFTVRLANLGPSDALNVSVADPLPAGLQYVSSTASVGSYDVATGAWTVGTVAAAASETLTITARVLAPASGPALPQTNTATVTSTTPDPNPDNNTGSSTETPKQADLAVLKAVSDTTPNVGDTITFVIFVTNLGPDTATNVVVNDRLPVGLSFVSATADQGSYDAGAGLWTVGTVAAGGFALLEVVATVDAPASGVPAAATNTATVSGTEYDPDPSNNTDSATETPQYADLAVDKVVSDARPNVGDVITYTVTLSNLGADTATGVTLLDQLPSGLQFVSAIPSQGSYDQASGIWTVGDVDTQSARTLSIQARVLPPAAGNPQPQTNTASVLTSDQYDPDPSNNTDSVVETPQYADLAVEKIVSDPHPNVGAQVTFTVTVRNLGADAATNVTLLDVLPAGLTFVSASPSAGTSYSPASGIWTVNTLPVGAAQTLTIAAAVARPGTFTNVAAVATSDQFDPNTGNNRDDATLTTRAADLAVVKTVSNATPNVGDTITFTITVSNDGPDSANNVEITDAFPTAGLQFLAATPSQGAYDAGTGVWTVGTVDIGPAAAQTLTLSARVLAPAVNTIPPSQTNVARVTKADEYDPNPGNNTGSATETPRYADLGVKKTTSNVQPNVGDPITYTVSLFNLGTSAATNVQVTDSLPGNVAFISATPAAGTRFTPTATGGLWAVPTIAPGQTLVLTLTARATATSVAFNTATITASDVWDPNNRNNTAKTPTDPQQADLDVVKTVDQPRPNVGDTITYTVALENLGPSIARDVVVTDPLPAGLEFVSATPSVGAYNAGTGVWTVGNVAANATGTLTILARVLAPASGPVASQTNTATAISSTPDPNPGNNTGTVTETPLQADLAIYKTVDKSQPGIGETIVYTLEVANYGTDTATAVQVQDSLPAGLTFVSAVASQGGYDAGTGVWTVGTVAQGALPRLAITAKVTRATGGTVTNTATVSGREYDPDPSNNTDEVEVLVPSSGVIVGTDIGCETGPFVRVLDPDTGADRIIPFFAYEPSFRGGVRVYGADVTGDGIAEIITAPGPGRPGQVKVFTDAGAPLPQYSFYPFGPRYTGGIEIAAGSITAAGTIQIVAAQNRGGTVRVFDVNPAAPAPVASAPVRQLKPFGAGYRGGVTVATADIGTFSGRTMTSSTPDGITELVTGSGPGMPATVKVYNGVPATPAVVNAFRPISKSFNRGISVARLPSSTPGNADKIMVSAGSGGGSLVETYAGISKAREAVFRAYPGSRADVFSAAINENEIFSVEGQFGRTKGVRKNTSPSGGASYTLPQSTASYPPLRVAILRK